MLLADTHVLLEFQRGDPRLSVSARRLVGEAFAQGELAVSAITVVEAVRLHEAGRIKLGSDPNQWVTTQIRRGLSVIPVDARIATLAPQLPRDGFHADPGDQMIAATAILTGYPVVTGDRQTVAWAEQENRIDIVDARG